MRERRGFLSSLSKHAKAEIGLKVGAVSSTLNILTLGLAFTNPNVLTVVLGGVNAAVTVASIGLLVTNQE